MPTIDPTSLVDQVLAVTEQVQRFVEEGNWADASELEKQRLALLTELFTRDDVAELGPEREQLARELLTRNGRMIDTLRTQRSRLNETSRRLNKAPAAVDAYRSNTPTDQWGSPKIR